MKEARDRLDELVRDLGAAIAGSLVGVYLHGSLALGCFNPALSDVDLLVVTKRPLTRDQRKALGPLLTRVPRLEIHFLTAADLAHWRHPAPYDAHYGSQRRLLGPGEDHDLAAHVTVVRHSGVALAGPPPADVFPEVPWEDYEDSLRRDLEWCGANGGRVYAVLSPARIWATLTEGVVHSKASGAAWALERVPDQFRPLLARALETYRTGTSDVWFERQEVRPFAEFVIAELRQRNDAGERE